MTYTFQIVVVVTCIILSIFSKIVTHGRENVKQENSSENLTG